MDLVAGVRKEGSRGGRADFKWEDVKDDAHRENYLGHSLMAPVGRWQQNRDLSWYAKSSDPSSVAAAAEARREELRRVKEAEQDAMSAALGYGPMPKSNANDTPIGKRDVEKALKETNGDDGEGYVGKGIGYGGFDGGKVAMKREEEVEKMSGFGMERREGADIERRREKRRRRVEREGMAGVTGRGRATAPGTDLTRDRESDIIVTAKGPEVRTAIAIAGGIVIATMVETGAHLLTKAGGTTPVTDIMLDREGDRRNEDQERYASSLTNRRHRSTVSAILVLAICKGFLELKCTTGAPSLNEKLP